MNYAFATVVEFFTISVLLLWGVCGLFAEDCSDTDNNNLVYLASNETRQLISYQNISGSVNVLMAWNLASALPWQLTMASQDPEAWQLRTVNGDLCLFANERSAAGLSACQTGQKAQQWHRITMDGGSSEILQNSDTNEYLDFDAVLRMAFTKQDEDPSNNSYLHWNFIKANGVPPNNSARRGCGDVVAFMFNPEANRFLNSPAHADIPIGAGSYQHATKPWHIQRYSNQHSTASIYHIKIPWNSSLSLCLDSNMDGAVYVIQCELGNSHQMWHRTSAGCGMEQFLSVQTLRYLSADKSGAVATKAFHELSREEKSQNWKLNPTIISDEGLPEHKDFCSEDVSLGSPFECPVPSDCKPGLSFVGIVGIAAGCLALCIALAVAAAVAFAKLSHRAGRKQLKSDEEIPLSRPETGETINGAEHADRCQELLLTSQILSEDLSAPLDHHVSHTIAD